MKKTLIDITDLITPVSYAKSLGVSKQYIYRIISEKKIDVIKIDNVMFVSRSKTQIAKK